MFDTNWLLLSMLISGAGTVLFLYGKRQARLPHLLTGIVLCVYPYFVTNLLAMTLIAAILGISLWLVVVMGA